MLDIPNFNYTCEPVHYVRGDARLNRVSDDYLKREIELLAKSQSRTTSFCTFVVVFPFAFVVYDELHQ